MISVNKTKILFVIIMISMSATAQNVVVESGASLLVELRADICTDSIAGAGNIIINGTVCGNPTDVDNSNSLEIPIEFSLEQNYPNPFNPGTKISWQSPVDCRQTLKVYDILGNEVATLVDEFREAGRYEIEFDASKLASGMYLYQLKADNYTETKKMILIK
uniref:T9SS type A sorting domain-containing protein n=1 Tax=Ignavibacterium album TaxID=591197 RepID=A0A7V3E826_9BACT